jgi:hypothetical protein
MKASVTREPPSTKRILKGDTKKSISYSGNIGLEQLFCAVSAVEVDEILL